MNECCPECTGIPAETDAAPYRFSGAAMAYGVQNDKRVALGTSAVLLVVMTRRFFVSLSLLSVSLCPVQSV